MNRSEAEINTQIIALSELQPPVTTGGPAMAGNLGLLQGVKVKLTAVVGTTETTLGELMSLKESSILKIDRQVDQPVDIIVDGNVIARGQLVVVDDNFGVRITEIASPSIV